MNKSSVQVGLRGKVETPKIAGYSLEAAAGVRVALKTPQFFKDIRRSIGF